jgi:hypothetical protein
MQKISTSGCAVFLVACPLLIAAVHRYLPPETGDAQIWFSVASGALLAAGLNALWLLLTGRVETRGDLLRRSESGQPPADGEAVLATGRLSAAPPLLTAPLSGTPCAAYFYRLYHLVSTRRRRASHWEERPVYWGYASRPLVVDTPYQSIAVAAPQLAIPRTPHSSPEAVNRAREYLGTVTTDLRSPEIFLARNPVLHWMSDISADEDGSARRDWYSGERIDPATLRLEELVLMPDVEVSVHGRWSARRNAIAATDDAGDVRPTIALGPATELGIGAGVPPSLVASWVATLITIAVGVGLIWFATNVWPQIQ